MALLSPTLSGATEFSGDYKILKLTATIGSASDTITLTKATHGIDEIFFSLVKLTAGYDAALTNIFCSHATLTITIVSTAAAGTASTNWDGATIEVLVIGRNIT